MISLDAMGGDHGPSVTLPACAAFLSRHPDARLCSQRQGGMLDQGGVPGLSGLGKLQHPGVSVDLDQRFGTRAAHADAGRC